MMIYHNKVDILNTDLLGDRLILPHLFSKGFWAKAQFISILQCLSCFTKKYYYICLYLCM